VAFESSQSSQRVHSLPARSRADCVRERRLDSFPSNVCGLVVCLECCESCVFPRVVHTQSCHTLSLTVIITHVLPFAHRFCHCTQVSCGCVDRDLDFVARKLQAVASLSFARTSTHGSHVNTVSSCPKERPPPPPPPPPPPTTPKLDIHHPQNTPTHTTTHHHRTWTATTHTPPQHTPPHSHSRAYAPTRTVRTAGTGRKRRCTDLVWLLAFVGFLCGLAYVISWSVKYGEPTRLVYGADSYGNICGELALTHTHTHVHTHARARTHTHTHTHTQTHKHSRTHTHTRTHTHILPHQLTNSLTHSLKRILAHQLTHLPTHVLTHALTGETNEKRIESVNSGLDMTDRKHQFYTGPLLHTSATTALLQLHPQQQGA
jgi:hypothetical protein